MRGHLRRHKIKMVCTESLWASRKSFNKCSWNFIPAQKLSLYIPSISTLPLLSFLSLTSSTKSRVLKYWKAGLLFMCFSTLHAPFARMLQFHILPTHFFAANSGNVCFRVTMFSQECQQVTKIEGILLT